MFYPNIILIKLTIFKRKNETCLSVPKKDFVEIMDCATCVELEKILMSKLQKKRR